MRQQIHINITKIIIFFAFAALFTGQSTASENKTQHQKQTFTFLGIHADDEPSRGDYEEFVRAFYNDRLTKAYLITAIKTQNGISMSESFSE